MKFKTHEVILAVLIFMTFAFIMGVCFERGWNYNHPQESKSVTQIVYMNADEDENLSRYEQAQLDIFKLCQQYEFNYNLVFSICRLETGNFESLAYKNWNYCGVTIGGEVKTYETKEEGLLALAQTMEYYRGQTIDQMAKKYCPANKDWAKSVKQIVKEEGGNTNATL